jgi:hypothetical protein
MVCTNLLLSLSFSILTNFPGIKDIDASIPDSIDGFKNIVIGSPAAATDVMFEQSDGTIYRVGNGVVFMIETGKSYFRAQGNHPFESYLGEPRESKEAIIERARTLAQKLVRSGLPLSTAPAIKMSEPYQSQTIPFYNVTWPITNKHFVSYTASFEVDGRTGKVVWISLQDRGFFDFGKAAAISNAVVTPSVVPRPLKPRPRFVAPFLSEQEVRDLICDWEDFSQKLGMKPSHVDYSMVDWSRTMLYTNKVLSSKIPVRQLWFSNGICFESFKGTMMDGSSSGSCYLPGWPMRDDDDWQQFQGKAQHRWEDLAAQFEKRLVASGIQKKNFKTSRPGTGFEPLRPGEEGIKHALIQWRIWPNRIGTISVNESKLMLEAEFDLQTGDLKMVYFAPDQGLKIAKILSKSKIKSP